MIKQFDELLKGAPVFYYVIRPTEDQSEVVWIDNRSYSGTFHSVIITCTTLEKPLGGDSHWTWLSFLQENRVVESIEVRKALLEEAREVVKVLNGLRTFLSTNKSLWEMRMDFLTLVSELSYPPRKIERMRDFVTKLASLPLPNDDVERSILFLLNQIERSKEVGR